MSPPEQANLRKVQPFLLARGLAQALEETARSMSSPMMPRVSLAAAARDLIAQGLASLDVSLRSGTPVAWRALDPPRRSRRREAEATAADARVRDATYVQISPLSLSEEIIARLESVRRQLSTATGAKVSTVKVLRESLARGLDARELAHAGVEALLQKYAHEFRAVGVVAPAHFTVIASGVTQKYAPPAGGADPWSQAPRASAPSRKAPAAPKDAPKATAAGRPRARGHRQQAAVRREPPGDGDGDDGPPSAAGAALPGAIGGRRG
ncbi:MAG: hypothetical protein Q8S73_01835 [Deltaproteobacteria bacterium]|nr:hypothetical protein [Myxococcales bacterium]MDP3212817.1 hypothetical protein [Deltaproteobacteria bacterium]